MARLAGRPLAPAMPYARPSAQWPRPQLTARGAGRGLGLVGTPATSDIRPYRGPVDTLAKMAEMALGNDGERSILVRQFTERVVRDIQPKDYLGEILAVRNALVQPSPVRPWVPMLRYLNDPLHVEFLRTPRRLVQEINEHGTVNCDCDESACLSATMCLQLGRLVEIVAMGFAPKSLSHVAIRVQEPKSKQWILLDGVAGPREAQAANKAVEILTRRLD